jgi:hypothetical protein
MVVRTLLGYDSFALARSGPRSVRTTIYPLRISITCHRGHQAKSKGIVEGCVISAFRVVIPSSGAMGCRSMDTILTEGITTLKADITHPSTIPLLLRALDPEAYEQPSTHLDILPGL